MDHSRSFYGAIAEIIRRETRYLRHYIGEVKDNQDPIKKGRVRTTVPLLGWDTPAKGTWCWPRDKHSMSVPKVGDWVEMYFLNGDPNIPIYLGQASEILDQIPTAYEGNPNIHVLFEGPQEKQKILYDEEQNVIEIGEADESYVKGDTFKSEFQKDVDALTQLQTDLTAWVPAPGDGGTALKTILTTGFLTKAMAVLTNILSDRIKAE